MRHSRRGGAVAAVLSGVAIIAVAALAVLGIAAWLVARNVRVTESAGQTRVETPFGSVRVREKDAVDGHSLGIPVYPGAERIEDSRRVASLELDFGEVRKDMRAAMAEYETRDPISKVEQFYRERLDGARVRRKSRERLFFEWGDRDLKRVAVLQSQGDRVRISLASIGDAAAN